MPDSGNRLDAELDATLTSPVVAEVLRRTGAHMAADRYGRERDLPFPRVVIEVAFIKALQSAQNERDRSLVSAIYVSFDDYLLSDEEYVLLDRWESFILGKQGQALRQQDPVELARAVIAASSEGRASAIEQELGERRRKRAELLDTIG